MQRWDEESSNRNAPMNGTPPTSCPEQRRCQFINSTATGTGMKGGLKKNKVENEESISQSINEGTGAIHAASQLLFFRNHLETCGGLGALNIALVGKKKYIKKHLTNRQKLTCKHDDNKAAGKKKTMQISFLALMWWTPHPRSGRLELFFSFFFLLAGST